MSVLIIAILVVFIILAVYIARVLKENPAENKTDEPQPKPAAPVHSEPRPQPPLRPVEPPPIVHHVPLVVENKTEPTPSVKTIHTSRSRVVLGPCSKNDAQVLFGRTVGQLRAVAAIQQPMVREVLWHVKGIETYHLAFPYCVFIVGFWSGQLAKMYVYFSNSRVTEPGDPLYSTNLPNVYADESVCLGHDQQLEEIRRRITGRSYAERAAKAIDQFWKLVFNDGMISNRFNPMGDKEPRLKTVGEWQRNSLTKRDFILGIKWQNAGTVSDALNRYLHAN